jgi:hypothetical protein
MKTVFDNWRSLFGDIKESKFIESDLLVDSWKSYLSEELGDDTDIVISSFELQDDFNRKIWTEEDDKIDPDARDKLLQIAQDFWDSLELEDVEVLDITLTGSLSNYNWSQYSDADLHIIIDLADVNVDIGLVREFLNAKKSIWNRIHDIYIRGFEVEVYVQGHDDPHESSGVYSILRDEWVKKPTREEYTIDRDNIQLKADSLMDQIDRVASLVEKGEHKEAHDYADKLKSKIRKMRQSGLEKKGIYSVENLAFKVLRRTDYLEKLSDLKSEAYDLMMSIEQ